MEEYRRFNDRLEVSDQANVKRDGKQITPCVGKLYDYVTDRGKMIRVHEMVAALFPEICGENDPSLHIHHINGNSKDNRAVNLVRIAPEDHTRLHQQENGVSVPVKAYDTDGNYVGRWDSKTQAAAATGVDYRHISEMVSGQEGRLTAGGYVWFMEDTTEEEVARKMQPVLERSYKRKAKEEQVKEKELIRQRNIQRKMEQAQARREAKKVLEYDSKGNLLKEWDSVKEVAVYYGASIGTIYRNLAGDTEYLKKGGEKRYFILKKYMPS